MDLHGFSAHSMVRSENRPDNIKNANKILQLLRIKNGCQHFGEAITGVSNLFEREATQKKNLHCSRFSFFTVLAPPIEVSDPAPDLYYVRF